MMRRKGLILTYFIILSTSLAVAQSSDPTEIVKYSDDLLQGQSSSGTYRMTVKTPSWERRLELKVYSKNKEKMLVRILSPAKESGIGTLRIKNEMWNYLPNVEKTIKIPPSMMLQPWMGSEFANDDLVKESSIVNDYIHRLAGEVILDGETCLQVELLPKPNAAVIWGKILLSVRKQDNVPVREEYFNEAGKPIKVLYYSNVGQVSDRVVPRTWRMASQIKPGQETTIELMDDVQYNIPIDDAVFSLTNLKKIQ
ncbi:MAG: outer membrane lipoprotein-sorting protein [Candidatus Omnitrophica bacterium]|nr:outer membrane lipoprotein-sorting protein [Candidatus Omnitrophota bacterium]